jgi:RNA polymerase-binding transcription factor DksA
VSDIDTSEFRRLLEEERARLVHASGRYQRENSETLEDEVGELGGRSTDDNLGDLASDTYERELDEGIEEGVVDTIRQIDAALQRIEDGTYGVSELSGRPIGEERLRAIPWATRCVDEA